jgi:hypothetical protein
MSSVTLTLPAVKSRHAEKASPDDRQAILVGTPTLTHAAILTLSVKGTEHVYALTLLPCDFGKGWRMTKEHDGECYDLHTDDRFPGAVECECQGFLRWEHCKHADTIAALLASGQL